MGQGTENEPPLTGSATVIDGILDDEDQTIGSLFKAKRPRQSKKGKLSEKETGLEQSGNVADGDTGGMGDTLAFLKKKLKIPRGAVGVNEEKDGSTDVNVNDSSSNLVEVEVLDVVKVAERSPKIRKRRPRASSSKRPEKHGNLDASQAGNKSSDEDLKDSLSSLVRKAHLGSTCPSSKKKKMVRSPASVIVLKNSNEDDLMSSSSQIEISSFPETNDSTGCTSNACHQAAGNAGQEFSLSRICAAQKTSSTDTLPSEKVSQSVKESPSPPHNEGLEAEEHLHGSHSITFLGQVGSDVLNSGSGVEAREHEIHSPRHGEALEAENHLHGSHSIPLQNEVSSDDLCPDSGVEPIGNELHENEKPRRSSGRLKVHARKSQPLKPCDTFTDQTVLASCSEQQVKDLVCDLKIDEPTGVSANESPFKRAMSPPGNAHLKQSTLDADNYMDTSTAGGCSDPSSTAAETCMEWAVDTVNILDRHDCHEQSSPGKVGPLEGDQDNYFKESAKKQDLDREIHSPDSQLITTQDKNMHIIEASLTSDSGSKDKKHTSIPRAARKIKKHRHGDMAYEGDAVWDVLSDDNNFLDTVSSADRVHKSRSKDRVDLLPSSPEAEDNQAEAAVTVGLKAYAAGPIEKIKFKDTLKRKGGIQEYIDCRNSILSRWYKNMKNFLTVEDCEIHAGIVNSESPQASLIKEIFGFLDTSGYINLGVTTSQVPKLHNVDECIDLKEKATVEYLLDKKVPRDADSCQLSDRKLDTSCTSSMVIYGKSSSDGFDMKENDVETGLEVKHEMIPLGGTGIPIPTHQMATSSSVTTTNIDTQLSDNVDLDADSLTTCRPSNTIYCEQADVNIACSQHETPTKNEKDGPSDSITMDVTSHELSNEHLEPLTMESVVSESKISNAIPVGIPPIDSFRNQLSANRATPKVCKSIIIIGAGPSGLTAARHLQRHGFSVTVLEARDRIGGRVYTDRSSLSVPVDLGASIITGVEADIATERRPDPSSIICSQLGLELTILNSDCPLYDTVTGKKVPADLDEELEAEYNSLLDDVVDMNLGNGILSELSLEEGLEYALKKHRSDELEADTASMFSNGLGINNNGEPSGISGSPRGIEDRKLGVVKGKSFDVLSPMERRVMDWHFAHLEYGCAASLKDVSLLHWNQDDAYGGFGGAHCMIKGGFSSVIESLANNIAIHLNHVVTDVSYCIKESEGDEQNVEVKVSTSNGKEFVGDAVLITLPLGCLKANSIKFSPPLPAWKQSSIKRLGFGVLNKVILEFSEVFWDDDVDYFGATAEESVRRGECFMFWNVRKTVGAPVLIALVAGKAAVDSHNYSSSDHVDYAVKVLRKLFGESLVPDPVASVVTNWGMDPFTRGAYSYVAVGATGEDYDILGKPVANCLFFAGEATCKEHPDTVGGAMLSGLREAVRIIDIFSSGKDYTTEVQEMEAAQKQVDSERTEVKEIVKRLDLCKLSNGLSKATLDASCSLKKVDVLRDMLCSTKTTTGRLHLAKELLRLPVDNLKSLAGTKEGLTILNSWILDSLGKDATQLLRHCVRLLVLVSTDLLAVRLSGIGKTIKDKVCVHTSRDIRAIASQLVSVWIEVFRKEKAANGALKLVKKAPLSDSSRLRGKDQGRALGISNGLLDKRGSLSKSGNGKLSQKPKKESPLSMKSDVSSSLSHIVKSESLCPGPADVMSPEEAAAFAAAEAASAAAVAAAEAYESLKADSSTLRELPKIPSFQKFVKRDQYNQVDDCDLMRQKFSSGVSGRQDCLSELDFRNCRVRNWPLDFSSGHTNIDGSRAADDHNEPNCLDDVQHSLNPSEHSADSALIDNRQKRAWVDTDNIGFGGVKNYSAIERWQSEAMDADTDFFSSVHVSDERDVTKCTGEYPRRHDGSCASQATESVSLSEGQPRGVEVIRQGLIDYVASLLMPLYKTRKIDKEGYKSVMKKATTKVIDQCTEVEKVMTASEFLDFKRKNKIRAFVDKLIERHLALNPNVKL